MIEVMRILHHVMGFKMKKVGEERMDEKFIKITYANFFEWTMFKHVKKQFDIEEIALSILIFENFFVLISKNISKKLICPT